MTEEEAGPAQAGRAEGVAKRGIGAIGLGEVPTRSALLAAVGGVRGIVESILPGFAFLLVFAITRSPWLSVIAPVAVAVVFVVVRLIQRGPVVPALGGLGLVVVSAALVLLTGNVNDNFLLGIWVNIAFLLGTLISLAVRWPLVGLVLGALSGDLVGWRRDPHTRRGATAATWVWAALFALRLAAELPLYFAGATETLAVVKLVLNLPPYAAALWITWLLLRRPKAAEAGADQESDPPAEN